MKRTMTTTVILAVGLFPLAPQPATAQSYPIDCAILLCLAGGWPASTECSLARTEFIRRATPVPVEPPLQIWRCPMRAGVPSANSTTSLNQREMEDVAEQVFEGPGSTAIGLGADIDISDRAFDFVRSINVYYVRATQRESASGDCNSASTVRHGSYGLSGEFYWQAGSIMALPQAFRGLDGYGEHCPSIWLRTVFVDWHDHQGIYGFEQIGY